jgi:hypothetical protein
MGPLGRTAGSKAAGRRPLVCDMVMPPKRGSLPPFMA